MGTAKRADSKSILWSIWLTPDEHAACELLIDELKKDGLLHNGPRGFVSRYKLIEFLMYNAIFMYQDRILPKEIEEIEEASAGPPAKKNDNNKDNKIAEKLRQLQQAKDTIVSLNTKNRELHDKIDKIQINK